MFPLLCIGAACYLLTRKSTPPKNPPARNHRRVRALAAAPQAPAESPTIYRWVDKPGTVKLHRPYRTQYWHHWRIP